MFKITSLIILATFLGLSSCSKDPINDLSTEESLVYITNRDTQADYKKYKTFSVVDSVTIIENNRSGSALTELDKDVLTRIISNMKDLGYVQVTPSQKPDIGINVAWITNSQVNVTTMPSYWGGFGYGYGFGYPSYYQYYETSESYWHVSMVDFLAPNTVDKTYKVVWDAQIRGSGIGSRDFVSTMIDSIYAQSGYLKK
ncbi:DUF4136 domain-containing protein [Dyadobacter sp. CY312]|uniref:DUF4136 domain-containing protein n=1 Tax=Dyadobacter sp. CY312 TaxID=2907303 RepID=UPI001F3DF9A2|nr:DUF4136 domain-containing protein [Dyadobacter sp. CY312]MCE7040058.1 DUF4136 domain-containing protein [Dyadobacter sp. CY312]